MKEVLEPYWWLKDKATNLGIQVEWLDAQIPYDQIFSWLTIAVLGGLAWWMAKYIVKNY